MKAVVRTILLVSLAVAMLFAIPSRARADGDPASDYLLGQQVFLPYQSSFSSTLQQRLTGLIANANRAGYRIRVALIASDYDLGSVTALWRKPRTYAHFLGEEIAFAYRGRLLVVMPNGFGFNDPHHPVKKEYGLLDRISIPAGSNGLLEASITAVQRLAAAGGVKVVAPKHVTTPASRNTHDRIVIIAAVGAAFVLAALARFGLRWRRRGAATRTSPRN